jgi:hypothetical protein
MYVEYFLQRLKSGDFLQEALDAQAKLV